MATGCGVEGEDAGWVLVLTGYLLESRCHSLGDVGAQLLITHKSYFSPGMFLDNGCGSWYILNRNPELSL